MLCSVFWPGDAAVHKLDVTWPCSCEALGYAERYPNLIFWVPKNGSSGIAAPSCMHCWSLQTPRRLATGGACGVSQTGKTNLHSNSTRVGVLTLE